MQERSKYLTVEEAAVRAKLSSVTIRRAIHDGKLRYRAEQGKTKLLSVVEVDEWVRQRTELRPLDNSEQ